MTGEVSGPARKPVVHGAYTPFFTIVDCLRGSISAIETWRRRHRDSMLCSRIESRILRDLGISESQRFIEVNKPFWEK